MTSESKTIVFKLLNELAPQYLCESVAQNSQCSSSVFVRKGRTSDYLRQGLAMARDVSPIEVQNCGIVSQPSQSRQPCCIVSRKPFRRKGFILFIVYRILLDYCTQFFKIINRAYGLILYTVLLAIVYHN